ncbi:uncharacterized protein SAPINGB_P003098 [Magnusiomyces paraingens]|uniref:Suppressor of forked domain-containing protein n=1 Tax=Magnusiomyces paraingens TaxID=2606893 RepID=A0A5E8BIG0_9ASCO|nr:uncharacterized protein SAPINGB_P003098 [Saprochaete ingens]VVT51444.1 unnamed protein product [Saprochaete ingens]
MTPIAEDNARNPQSEGSFNSNGHSKPESKPDELLNPAFKEWSQIYSFIEYNPDSFSAWEDLIEISENLEGGLSKASSSSAIKLFRFTFDTFLNRFPLAQGYWIKFAELEFKLGNTEQALMIYDKAVNVIPLSVELWTHYCAFKTIVTPSIKQARVLFEKAANCVGYHYLSHPFWDEYIKFEKSNGDSLRLFKLYLRIVQIPLHQYAKYFYKLFQLAPNLPVKHLVSAEYLEQFNAEYEIEQLEKEEEEREKKLEPQSEANPNLSSESKSIVTKRQLEEKKKVIEADLRHRIYNYYSRLYIQTQKKVNERFQYESEIQRQFFHVLYLPEEEIQNWRRYLQFMETENAGNNRLINNESMNELVALYERSIIPFGHYEEFWLRYTKFLVANNKIDEARNVYRRASFVLPIGRIQVRLQYALFEESYGNIDIAKNIFLSLLDALPFSTELIVGYANLLHRSECAENAISYLEQKLEHFKLKLIQLNGQSKIISEDKEGGNLNEISSQDTKIDADIPALVTVIANSYLEWLGSVSKARQIFQQFAQELSSSYYFWREYLRFEIGIAEDVDIDYDTSKNADSHGQKDEESIFLKNVYDQIKIAALEPNQRKDLAHIYMVFLLSQGNVTSGATQKYFEIDKDAYL